MFSDCMMNLSYLGFVLLLFMVASEQQRIRRRGETERLMPARRNRRQKMNVDRDNLLQAMLDKRESHLSNITRQAKALSSGSLLVKPDFDENSNKRTIGERLRLLKEKQKMQRTADLRKMLMRLRLMERNVASNDCESLKRENEELKKQLELKDYELEKLLDKEELETSVNFKMLEVNTS